MIHVSFRRIASVEQLQLEYTDTQTVSFSVSLVRLRLEAYIIYVIDKIR